MKVVNIQAAKTHLSRLVEQVAKGEEVILARAGRPLVRMVPFVSAVVPRRPGLMVGQGWEAPDCWASSEEKEFEDSIGKPLFHGAVEEPPASP